MTDPTMTKTVALLPCPLDAAIARLCELHKKMLLAVQRQRPYSPSIACGASDLHTVLNAAVELERAKAAIEATQTDQQLREVLGRVKLGLLARDSKGRVMSPVSNHRLIEIIDDALSSSSLTK